MELRKQIFPGLLHTLCAAGLLAIQGGYAQTNVTVWGDNAWGQNKVPIELTNAVAIASGGLHIMALKSDGTVRVWGNDSYSQTSVRRVSQMSLPLRRVP